MNLPGLRLLGQQGLVTDVIEFSAVDGPGNRFVVFLQGCNLNCLACHNPYTINPCLDCGDCISTCPSGAISFDLNQKIVWDATVCAGSDTCLDVCEYDSTPKARDTEVADLLARIRRAAPFLSGITVSGGEATQQPEFVRALFTATKSEFPQMTCFVDSNGDTPAATWDLLRDTMDAAMIDLKCLDDELHRKIAGGPNEQVLESIRLLASRGQLHEVRLLIVAGINDSPDLLDRTGRWLAEIDPKLRIKVIGYRGHGVRPSPIPLREPSLEQLQHYTAQLGTHGEFEFITI